MEQDKDGDDQSMIIQPDRPVIIDCKFPYLPIPDTYTNQLKELIKEEHTNVKASDNLETALVEIGEKYPDSRACITGSLYLCGYVLRVN